MSGKDTRLQTLEAAFKAFADPTRLRILGLLAAGEICVCNIHECLGIPQPTASRHLAYLRKKGLVLTRKDGLWVHYKLAPLEEPVMRMLMTAVTHAIGHCESIKHDRQRLESETGCCVPISGARFECCGDGASSAATSDRRRQERRRRSD